MRWKLRHLLLLLGMLVLASSARAQNGTPYLLKDINAQLTPAGSSPAEITRMGNLLYFVAVPFSENELWKSDGTTAGTIQVKNLGVAGAGNATSLVALNNNTLLFTASDSTTGRELWKSDGTAAGTARIGDFNPGPSDSVTGRFTVVSGGVAFYVGIDTSGGHELWRTNGTVAGTFRVKDINPGPSDSNPFGLVVLNGVLYFAA